MEKNRNNISMLTRLALLSAVIFLLAFTPFGYLRLGVLSITFLPIPVAVGAILMGPGAGAFLGGVFGLTSFLQCFGLDPFGTALFAINPFYTFILTMIPRIIMGWLAGVAFKSLSRLNAGEIFSFAGAALVAPLVNTVLVTGGIILMFGSSEFILGIRGGASLISFIAALVSINGVVEAVATMLIATAVCKVTYRLTVKA